MIYLARTFDFTIPEPTILPSRTYDFTIKILDFTNLQHYGGGEQSWSVLAGTAGPFWHGAQILPLRILDFTWTGPSILPTIDLLFT
jgi:hypothetical protein